MPDAAREKIPMMSLRTAVYLNNLFDHLEQAKDSLLRLGLYEQAAELLELTKKLGTLSVSDINPDQEGRWKSELPLWPTREDLDQQEKSDA
jgi:hypothetical protein